MSGLMKWPGTTDKPDKSEWLKGLSDDELDDLMVQGGLMDQDELDHQRDMKLVNALAKLPGGRPDYCETLRGLVRLRDEGQLPPEAKDMYDRLRTRALANVEAAQKAAPKVMPARADVPADTSIAGWLKSRWSSADETVRHALQAVASAVGASIPMSRTRKSIAGGKDSSSARRTEPTLQPNQPEARRKERPAEAEPDHYDRPQWSDDDAEGWTACSSLPEAFRSDRDWY